jgi:hypothetical protein
MLKCVNLIEIRLYAYLYASTFLVLWDHCADIGTWIRGAQMYTSRWIGISIQMSTSWVDFTNTFYGHCTDRHCLVYFLNQTRNKNNCKLNKGNPLKDLFSQFVSSKIFFQTMSICTMTIESVCKIYPRRWHLNRNSYSARRIHLS